MLKKPRGYTESVYTGSDTLVSAWKDSGAVYIASNCIGVDPMGNAKDITEKPGSM